ncbi:3-hydroxyacyl-[acyl-carrier-protein] dehydratase FabZ [Desulfosarcina ovata subsp. sediminis]|uniref:3-hydroxyacyl-[acyl-carrier-protein] dehydratase FabZ n=3 Tax=Desulfosarcina ovata TaxID=83564 RepID=A0A5K8A890_9BACT|nr:3-hydroxyacyl-ACP dehydratase FabZ [Desulfosarcina ovata]BBO81386.1 3-hydroxyacyl-[acyl-carrier-protein] dehydratase FabZ [Desulfosarcina ovata subsp. sediminis]BBO88638.1 3-hydroxyacyl-[acyl-carrier-protein] dehydratase FabZ [Desulfosarcina ovata subsp. ovata]
MEMVFDIKSIMQNLPHRFPFLLVDRIVEFVKNERIVALKNVTINEPFFQGHFPDTPIMPGVLIVEAMGQAGGVLVIRSQPSENQNKLVLFMGFDKVRFRKPVVPGDQLILELEMLKMRAKVVKMAGVAKVDGKVVAEAQLMAAYGE